MNTNVPCDPRPRRYAKNSRVALSAVRLGSRYGVSDDQVRNWSKLPLFPCQIVPGRWLVSEFDAAVSVMRAAGGPEAWRWYCCAQAAQKKQPSMEDIPITMNAVQLGARYGVSDDTVRNWSMLPGFPLRAAPGRWPVKRIDEWVTTMLEIGGVASMKAHVNDLLLRGTHPRALTPAKIAELANLQNKLSIFLSDATDAEELLGTYMLKPGTTDEFIPAPPSATATFGH